MRRIILGLLSLSLSVGLVACQSEPKQELTSREVSQAPTIQTNFYQTINKEWLNGSWVSSALPGYNEFTRLQMAINDQLLADLQTMADGQLATTTPDQAEFVKLYKKGFDVQTRRADGVESVKPLLDEMTAVQSFDELLAASQDWIIKDYPLPFRISIVPNPKNRSEHIFRLEMPKTILTTAQSYEDEQEKARLLESYRQSASHVLVLYGYDKILADAMVEEAIAFDARLVPYLSSESFGLEQTGADHYQSVDHLNSQSNKWKLGDRLSALVSKEVKEIYVGQPDYVSNLDRLVSEETFDDYRSWALVGQMMSWAPYLTGELMQTAGQFSAEVEGQGTSLPNDYVTYLQVTGIFKDTLSVYYGQTYVDSEVKEEVTEMVEAIIATYRERILEKDWLSPETKQAAIRKLEQLTYHVGYQDEVSEAVKAIKIDDNRSYAQNMLAILAQQRQSSFAHYETPVNRQAWDSYISSSDVTAAYFPYQNAIYLPAGVLQAPFYDKEQSLEQNYAAIGNIIAHEITHAFDSQGSKFDEFGNMTDWWTPEDRQAFEEKCQAMLEAFDGIEIDGGHLDGKLTLFENIADAGGLAVALETLKKVKPDADLQVFFEQFALSRRQQLTQEHALHSLKTEVHAPEELRVNIQVQQLDDFYKVYDIEPGNPMYRAPEDRIVIW